LAQKGLIDSAKKPVKVLGNGAIGIAITLTECKVSEAAKQKIQEAGGTVV
jgi:ribosomal protein L15